MNKWKTGGIWKGSAASPWYSRPAAAPRGNAHYNQPIRGWDYDADFPDPARLPPETPMLNLIMKNLKGDRGADFYVYTPLQNATLSRAVYFPGSCT